MREMVLNMNALNSRIYLNAFTLLQSCYTSSIQPMSSMVGLLGTLACLAYLAVEIGSMHLWATCSRFLQINYQRKPATIPASSSAEPEAGWPGLW